MQDEPNLDYSYDYFINLSFNFTSKQEVKQFLENLKLSSVDTDRCLVDLEITLDCTDKERKENELDYPNEWQELEDDEVEEQGLDFNEVKNYL